MRLAILAYMAVAWGLLFALDHVWPVWPVHLLVGLAAVVVAALAGLAWVAAGRRVGRK